jgi:FkbH-like protein
MSVDLVKNILERYSGMGDLRSMLAGIRDFEKCASGIEALGLPEVRVAVAGNYSTQFICKALPFALAANGVRGTVFESGFNAWQIDLRDPGSDLYAFSPSHIILTLTSIDLAYGSLRAPAEIVQALSGVIDSVMINSEARLLITLPEPLEDELSDQCSVYSWRRKTREAIQIVVQGNPRVTLIDIDPLVRSIGNRAWFDGRFYDTSKLPFHPDNTARISDLYASAVAGTVVPRCKLVICDMDDTMWQGRVGDDGWQGVGLDPSGGGRHHLRLQHFLKGLSEQGVLLAIASKNEVAPVLDVFRQRPEMILALDDFVARQIHWEPKSTSIERILTELNLTTAGVVFLDDNPVERDEVRRRFPDVFIPELPENVAEWVPLLVRSGRFDRRVNTDESKRRLELYGENAERERHKAAVGDIGAFLSDLKMRMSSYGLELHRERVLELIQKTNQFNLTTRRYGWAEVVAASAGGVALCYRLKDRFGDNGIVSVIIAKNEGDGVFSIDLWLMSCRVMARTFENAIIDDVIARVRALGGRELLARYIPTAKNAPVKELYDRLGFERGEVLPDGTVLYRYAVLDRSYLAKTEYITVETAAEMAINGSV